MQTHHMLAILTFNVAVQNIRYFNQPAYWPVKYVKERHAALVSELLQIDADIMLLQEVFHRDIQDGLYDRLKKNITPQYLRKL